MKLFDPKFHKMATQKQLEKNIIRYIVCSMKPLSTVDDPNFVKIITDINSELSVMSRRKLGRKIDEDYGRVIEKLKESFHSVDYVSTTADIWSTKHKSFMGVTAHWINKELIRCSCVLDCRRFKGAHTYDKIAELLYDITSEYGLKYEQLVSTITDNGSNFVKAFAEFGVPINFYSETDSDSNTATATQGGMSVDDISETDTWQFETICINDQSDQDLALSSVILPNHLRCASHTLNLLATTVFQNAIKGSAVARIHHPAFAKCTGIWNASRRPKSSEMITDLLGSSLTYPCPTRWNSLFDATEQLLKFKEKLNEVNSKLGFGAFKEVEIEYLIEFCTLMKPIALALDFLQREQNCFYGQLLPTLFSLQHRLQKLQSKTLRHSGFLLNNLLNSLNKRFQIFFGLSVEANEAILATCFHPMFKLRWIPENLESERKRIQDLCINSMDILNLPGTIETKSDTSETEEEFLVFSPTTEKKEYSQKELELASYFSDKAKSISSLNNYPNIKKLFIRYNTSLCSSAAVERLFSYAGFINSPTRGSLSDGSLRKLVFLKGNQDFV